MNPISSNVSATLTGVSEVDYSRYPGLELQRDWLQVYLQSYRCSSGRDAAVTDADVFQLYVQVCKFSLVSLAWH